MQLFMGDGGADVHVRGIAFINGRDGTDPGTSRGGGLNVAGFSNWTGNVRIEQCAFINNYAERGSAVAVNGGYRARILNSLFFQNVVKTHAAVYMNNYHGEPGAGLYFVNNTVLNNDVVARQGFRMAGVWVHASCDGCGAFVANNLVWGNSEGDITVSADTHAYLYNNNYDELDGAMPANASNNTSVEPVFEPGILNFTPALDSVMVDAGRREPIIIIFPPPFGSHWDYGELDANGMERVQNRRVDIGAFEAARESSLFVDGFGL